MKTHNTFGHGGFTVIELLIVLAIISIVATVAVPSLQTLYFGSVSSASINQVSGLVRYARSQAVNHNTTVTLCPSEDGIECANSPWEDGVLMFSDQNINSEVDGDDIVHRYQTPFIRSGRLRWRSLRNKVQFNSRGMPRGTVGSFTYCPQNSDVHLAESLIISFQGRVRSGRDSNGDGIKETGSRVNIDCS